MYDAHYDYGPDGDERGVGLDRTRQYVLAQGVFDEPQGRDDSELDPPVSDAHYDCGRDYKERDLLYDRPSIDLDAIGRRALVRSPRVDSTVDDLDGSGAR